MQLTSVFLQRDLRAEELKQLAPNQTSYQRKNPGPLLPSPACFPPSHIADLQAYSASMRPQIDSLQAYSGAGADSLNPHLYCHSRGSWNLFLDLTSTCKGLTCSALHSFKAFLNFNAEPTCCVRARVTQIFYSNNKS